MTTVYVLVGQFNHGGDIVLGVYTSREQADIAYTQYINERSAFDDYDIYPVELGANADTRW